MTLYHDIVKFCPNIGLAVTSPRISLDVIDLHTALQSMSTQASFPWIPGSYLGLYCMVQALSHRRTTCPLSLPQQKKKDKNNTRSSFFERQIQGEKLESSHHFALLKEVKHFQKRGEHHRLSHRGTSPGQQNSNINVPPNLVNLT